MVSKVSFLRMILAGFLTNVFAVATAASVTLAWNRNPEADVTGYRLAYGTTLGVYPSEVRTGIEPTASVINLVEGATYYFVISAINAAGFESEPSSVISYWVKPSTVTNQAPVALANSLTIPEDTPLNVTLGGTDSDNNPLTYVIVRAPAKGVFSGTAPSLKYTPSADSTGTDSFTFTVSDGSLVSNVATVSINVLAVNDAPVAVSKSAATNQGASVAILLNGSDKDSFTLSYTVVTGPANGTLLGTAPNLTYAPAASFSGADQFTYRVSDGLLNSAIATISIAVAKTTIAPPPVVVAPANVAPAFTSNPLWSAGASEGSAYIGQTLAGRAVDSGPVVYWKISGPAWLSVASNGDLSGTPPLGSAGVNYFTIGAADSLSLTATTTLQISVAGLPVPWQSVDIGRGQLAGSAFHNNGTITQTGAGAIGGKSDTFRFTYQMLSSDGDIIAKVSSLPGSGTWMRAGVMIRESLAQNARQVFMGLCNSTTYRWDSRTKTGSKTSSKSSITGAGAETWVRLVRRGGAIMAYRSANGTSWTYVGATKVRIASECYIGLALASGGNSVLSTVQFSNIYVAP